jgi:hypothetical protein
MRLKGVVVDLKNSTSSNGLIMNLSIVFGSLEKNLIQKCFKILGYDNMF